MSWFQEVNGSRHTFGKGYDRERKELYIVAILEGDEIVMTPSEDPAIPTMYSLPISRYFYSRNPRIIKGTISDGVELPNQVEMIRPIFNPYALIVGDDQVNSWPSFKHDILMNRIKDWPQLLEELGRLELIASPSYEP